jgi:iron complex outermembrane recepter protein
MEAAIFYKDIKNFIVPVKTSYRKENENNKDISDLPLTLPVNQVTEFVIPQNMELYNVNITINGEKAYVYGIELSYNQYFENGFFVQSNMTLLNSEATLDPSIRVDTVPLPDQADVTANLTIGWENDDFSARLIANHRSKIFEEVGGCPTSADLNNSRECKIWSDRYQDAIKSLDFKAKYNINKHVSVYFDAINLTDEVDLRYFEGNEQTGGNILYQKEEYGRTFQVGLNYKFY